MKKPLLKTALICLGITLLCGMSSFRTLKGEDLQQSYQSTSISNDTLITPNGEEAQYIKEVVIESNQSNCICSLFVSYAASYWSLNLKNYSNFPVEVSYTYTVYPLNGEPWSVTDQRLLQAKQKVPTLASGFIESEVCVPERLDVVL